MSLIKLKSKKEPLYTTKSIVNFDEDLKETTLEPIKELKENEIFSIKSIDLRNNKKAIINIK